jgi:hypothetical protein
LAAHTYTALSTQLRPGFFFLLCSHFFFGVEHSLPPTQLLGAHNGKRKKNEPKRQKRAGGPLSVVGVLQMDVAPVLSSTRSSLN